jgi:hypothetical protein
VGQYNPQNAGAHILKIIMPVIDPISENSTHFVGNLPVLFLPKTAKLDTLPWAANHSPAIATVGFCAIYCIFPGKPLVST